MKYLYETTKGVVIGAVYLAFLGMVFKLLYIAFMFGWDLLQWTT